jgi:hypothetical protein
LQAIKECILYVCKCQCRCRNREGLEPITLTKSSQHKMLLLRWKLENLDPSLERIVGYMWAEKIETSFDSFITDPQPTASHIDGKMITWTESSLFRRFPCKSVSLRSRLMIIGMPCTLKFRRQPTIKNRFENVLNIFAWYSNFYGSILTRVRKFLPRKK